jgi:beta-xylosidase
MENDPGTRNCWAPELFYDDAGSQWFIIWSSTVPGKFPETDGQDKSKTDTVGYNHRVYYVTTKDFTTFSPSKLLFNPGFNCIDAAIFQDGKKYVLVFKDESNAPFPVQKNLKLAFADHPEGPYAGVSAPISSQDPKTGKGIWSEGPTPIKIGGQWLIYFDEYTSHSYGLITSTDLKTWTDLTGKFTLPQGLRHGTIFHAPPEIIEALKKVE